MSYSRWGGSCWYAFDNINGKLSLWYDLDHTIDLTHEECQNSTVPIIMELYGCTEKEANEAMKYIGYYLDEHTAEECAENMKKYEKGVGEFMAKLNDEKQEKNDD